MNNTSPKITHLAFILSMPGNNSWNGRWSGEEKLYVVIRRVYANKKAQEQARTVVGGGYYSHNFGDGWRAAVHAKSVTAKQARELRKKSQGFCGYEWMIANILSHGSASDKPKEVEVAA